MPTMTKTRIEKVTTRDHTGRKRSVRMEITSESAAWVTGFEVDREGCRKEPSAKALADEGAETGEIMHVIDAGAIISREPLTVSPDYGWLVDAEGRDA